MTATVSSLAVLDAADERRRAGLRRMRILATSLLGAAAIGFALTHGHDGVLGYVSAFCEAGMVGALADWFAVTALFRHPLGIPVPHTALVPKRKDSLAVSLEQFVQAHFLTGDAVRERYTEAEISRRLGLWLTDERHAARVVHELSRVGRRVLRRLRDEDARGVLEAVVLPRLIREPVSPLAGTLLGQLVADGGHEGLVELGCDELIGWLDEHPQEFEDLLTERLPQWAPQWLSGLVAERVHVEVRAWLLDIRDQPGHRVRAAVTGLLTELAENLQHDPATIARTEALKTRWLEHPQTLATAMSLWQLGRTTLHDALDEPDGHVRRRLTEETIRLGQRITTDSALRERIDEDVGAAIAFVVGNYAGELAPVISQVIARWDGREAAERIELHVGRDLQFIRINGTIVGGLAGIAIHALSSLL